ncbi:hypothetical protein GQ53DRAFT_824544 [Thozetella sp. PMI_491]|nr:hypothetical protein GQ53DRAFT_824544 [Thozetella sp. PMI_491]
MKASTSVVLSALGSVAALSIPPVQSRQELNADVVVVNPATADVNQLFAGAPLSIAQVSALAAIKINPLLVPSFGVTKGITATDGSADCQGSNGTAIPCFCPPNPLDFLQKLDFAVNQNGSSVLGTPIRFSNDINDHSEQAIKDRATASIIVLQNFNGTFGVGCPAASAPDILKQQITGQLSNETVRDLIVAGVQ